MVCGLISVPFSKNAMLLGLVKHDQQSESWRGLSFSSVLKVFHMLYRITYMNTQLGGEPRKISWVYFPELFPFCSLSSIFGSLSFPFLIL